MRPNAAVIVRRQNDSTSFSRPQWCGPIRRGHRDPLQHVVEGGALFALAATLALTPTTIGWKSINSKTTFDAAKKAFHIRNFIEDR